MIKSIIWHDLRQIIYTRKTWYCLAALHALMGIIFNWLINSYLQKQIILDTANHGITEEVIHPFYAWFALITLISTPMLTTQLLCAEKSAKTIINYYCAPLTATQVIVGKFLTGNIILLSIITSISIIPLPILSAGALDWGQYYSSIFGSHLLLSAALAIGLGMSSFVSSITRANVVIFFSILLLVLLEWAAQFTGANAIFLQKFGLLSPLKSFLAGTISLQATAYYLLIICAFLALGTNGFKRTCYAD